MGTKTVIYINPIYALSVLVAAILGALSVLTAQYARRQIAQKTLKEFREEWSNNNDTTSTIRR